MAEVGKLTYRLDIDGQDEFDRDVDKSREKVKEIGEEAKKTDKKTSKSLDNITKGPLRDLKNNFNVTRLVIRDTGEASLKSFTRISEGGKKVVVSQQDIVKTNEFLRKQVVNNLSVVTNSFDVFGKRVKRGKDDIGSFRHELAQTASVTRSLQVAFSGFRGAALIGAVTLGAGVLVELAGAALAASGALLALPAAGVVAAGAFAAVRIATTGMGDAFKAIADKDAEKLQEALANMSPAARRFVLAAKGFNDAFKPVRTAVQEALFGNLDREMERLTSGTMPVLRSGLVGVADAMNQLAVEAAETVRTPFFKGLIQRSLGGTAQAVRTLSGAVSPLTEVLDRLVEAGMPFIQQLAVFIRDGAIAAAAFLRTESGMAALQQRISVGVGVLNQLGGLVSALSSALINLFSASEASGQTLIETLTEMVTQFNEFATSAEGSEALTDFFSFANLVLRESLTIIGALASVVLAVTDAIGELPQPAQDFLAKMTALAIVLTPVVLGLATFVNSVIALGPVLALATGPIGLIVIGLALLVAALIYAWNNSETFRKVVIGVWEGIKGAVLAVVDWFIKTLVPALVGAWDNVKKNIEGLGRFFSDTWDGIKRTVSNAWEGIKSAVSKGIAGVIRFVTELPGRVVRGLGNIGSLLFDAGKRMLEGLGNGIQSAVEGVKNKLRDFAKGALDTIKDFFGIRSPSRVMAQMGGYMMAGLAQGIQRNTAQAIGAARSASQAALGAFSGGTITSPSISSGAATALRTSPDASLTSPASRISSAGVGGQAVTINVNMSGIMTRSRADQRAIAKDMFEAINEERRAMRLPEIGGGALAA